MRRYGGNTLRDVVGENHGTLINMEANDWVGGSPTKSLALNFDGTNEIVTIDSIALDASVEPWAISCWLNGYAASNEGMFIGDASTNNYLWIQASAFKVKTQSETSTTISTEERTSWTHFAVTNDGSNTMRTFVNAAERNSFTHSIYNTFNLDRLGNGYNSDLYSLRGLLSDVRIYSGRYMHPAAIHQLYQESKRGYPSLFRRKRHIPFEVTGDPPVPAANRRRRFFIGATA